MRNYEMKSSDTLLIFQKIIAAAKKAAAYMRAVAVG
jgi:hypothetical protein